MTVPETDVNSTVELLFDARDRIEEIDIEGTAAKSARNQTLESINRSAEAYRQDVLANSTDAFDHIRDAQRGIDALAKETSEADAPALRNASERLRLASNITARLSYLEAEQLVEDYEGEFDNPGQRQKAESALGNAVNALHRGDGSRRNAAVHYRNAWKQADRAVATVETNIEPELQIAHGFAVEDNGTILVPIHVNLTDARSYAYEQAEVTIDGGEPRTINLTVGAFAGSSAAGTTFVELGSDLENRPVSVTATSTRDPNRTAEANTTIAIDEDDVSWERPDSNEQNSITVDDDSTGVTIDASGEGLFEDAIHVRNVTSSDISNDTLSHTVRITNTTDFEHATVTLPITGPVDDFDNVTLVKWDPETDDGWHAVNTTVDRENLTATANVTSFSYFRVSTANFESYRKTTTSSLTWPQLEDFESLDGWETDGAVTLNEKRVLLSSTADDGSSGGGDDDSSGGSDGGSSGGSDDGSDSGDGDGTDDGQNDDPLEICVPIFGCYTIPLLSTQQMQYSSAVTSSQSAGSVSNEATLTRTATIPEGADRVWFETRVSSDRGQNGNTVVTITGESDTETISVEDSQLSSWDTIEADLTSFAGEEVSIQFRTSNDASLRVDYVSVLADPEGSGFPDAVEKMDLKMPPRPSTDRQRTIDLDPTRRDTNGDNLRDSQVLDIEWEFIEYGTGNWVFQAKVFNVDAHPELYDTDGDGVSDYDELRIWDTDPLQEDTSEDGFDDLVDPNPLTRSSPPEVKYSVSGAAGAGGIYARDESGIESVEYRGYYEQNIPHLGDSEWIQRSPVSEQTHGDWAYYGFNIIRGISDRPEEVYLNVTDEEGHTVSYHAVSRSGADGYKIESVAVATHRLPNEKLQTVLRGSRIAGGAVAGAALYTWGGTFEQTATTYEGESVESTTELAVPTTTTAMSATTPNGLDITLPSGAVYQRFGFQRGFGWKYIDATSSITQSEIENAIENAGKSNILEEDGEIRYIIGEGPSETVILSIIGSTVVAASSYDSVDEPTQGCEKQIHYNENKLTEHVLESDKDINSITTILDAVTNPVQIWKSSRYRYYIGNNNKGYYVVKVTKDNPFFDLVINTVLMDGGSYYDTLEEAEDQLDNNQPDDPNEIEDTTEPNC